MNSWQPDAPALIYKRAMIGARTMKPQKRRANWLVAMDLFVVGSTHARLICHYAGIDPDDTQVSWCLD